MSFTFYKLKRKYGYWWQIWVHCTGIRIHFYCNGYLAQELFFVHYVHMCTLFFLRIQIQKAKHLGFPLFENILLLWKWYEKNNAFIPYTFLITYKYILAFLYHFHIYLPLLSLNCMKLYCSILWFICFERVTFKFITFDFGRAIVVISKSRSQILKLFLVFFSARLFHLALCDFMR